MKHGGNRPGAGRPAGSPNADTAAARAALAASVYGHIGTAIEALAYIAAHGTSEAARVSAACAILDRAYGKPMQASVEVSVGEAPQAFDGWHIKRAAAPDLPN
jgi:3-oxoacyl-(acyl-carrier-protein) synthase